MLIRNQNYCLCGCWDEKLSQMSLTQTGGAAGWLVGAHRQVAAPKDAVIRAASKTSHTQHSVLYVFPHKITKLQEFWVFRKENILNQNWELNWAGWNRGWSVGCCQVDGRTRHTPLLFSFVWISSFLRWWCFNRREQRHCRWNLCLLIRNSFTHSPESSQC